MIRGKEKTSAIQNFYFKWSKNVFSLFYFLSKMSLRLT